MRLRRSRCNLESISSVVRLMLSGDPKSTDRLRCVRGFSKHVGTVLSETAGESESLHVNDPVCTLLRTTKCVALTLGVVTALSTTSGASSSRKTKSSSILLS